MAEKGYPIIPERNWWDVRSQFNRTLPTLVTPSYLQTLLGLDKEKSAKNLLVNLKKVGLVDETNKPTDRGVNWRDDEAYSKVCKDIAEEVYPQELRELYPTPSENRDAVINWFKRTTKIGEATAKLVASTYTLIMEPNLEHREEKTKPKTAAPKTKAKFAGEVKRAAKEEVAATLVAAPEMIPEKHVSAGGHQKNPSIHIDLQIHISPEADASQIDAIFASMAKHLYR